MGWINPYMPQDSPERRWPRHCLGLPWIRAIPNGPRHRVGDVAEELQELAACLEAKLSPRVAQCETEMPDVAGFAKLDIPSPNGSAEPKPLFQNHHENRYAKHRIYLRAHDLQT